MVTTNPRPIATQEEVVELLRRVLKALVRGAVIGPGSREAPKSFEVLSPRASGEHF